MNVCVCVFEEYISTRIEIWSYSQACSNRMVADIYILA